MINFIDLKKLCEGDEKFYIEMLEVFVSSTKSGFENMHDSIKKKDHLMLAEYSHKMCSPLRHLNANELLDKLKEIERLSRKKANLSKIEEKVVHAESLAQSIFQIINKELDQVHPA